MIPPALTAVVMARAAEAGSPPLVLEAGPGQIVRIGGRDLVNMASCDYLGFARHPRVVAAARRTLEDWGLGNAAGRVLSGNTVLHRTLERRIASWVGCEDAVLHGSCWNANAAVFGALAVLATQAGSTLTVFSDRLNHASIIDAIRAQHRRVSHLGLYSHHDTADLRRQMQEHAHCDVKVIVTDGVFSMEGDQAPLTALRDLANEFDALLVVDDSHGIGVLGRQGRGTAEEQDCLGDADLISGTLGKALGGATGGFVAASTDFTHTLRSLSRPYTFSNNPPPAVIAGALAALDILQDDTTALHTLRVRTRQLREGVARLGLSTYAGEHPVVPVITGDEKRTQSLAQKLRDEGVFTTPITFPVVPAGEARLRLQVTATHSQTAIDQVITALERHPVPQTLA
ncbi:glycine C-acetyltransferase [Streptomyces rhizosphaericus]|uniref:8-amino-7-oxononanoate synthase n=2 Tax=Streptomyces TaxID=1883 RepID=A0ABN1RD94_9ACTN